MQSLNRLKSERPRKAYDFYETPIELARTALTRLDKDTYMNNLSVLDVGAGSGVWGNAYKDEILDNSCLWGLDIQELPKPASYDAWIYGTDFLVIEFLSDRFDLIMGNPPYSLAEEFVRKSYRLLEEKGQVFFLLRLAFLESKKRHFGLFTDHPPKRVYVLSRRPSFFTTKDGSKTTDALSYAMFLWQKGWTGKTELDWLYWEYD